MIVMIVAGEDGKSHFEHIDPKEWQIDWQVDPAKGPINFRSRPPGYFSDFHTEHRNQYAIMLSGQVDIEIGDGTILRFGPGDIVFATDITGHGHTVKTLGDDPWMYCAIPSD